MVDMPVYSLATVSPDGVPNMNICSYATPITMEPKQYCIGVYKGSKTLANLESGSAAILQILASDQYRLVRRFGYKSGHDTDKLKTYKGTLDIGNNGITYLSDCLAHIELTMHAIHNAGDHMVYLGIVTSYGYGSTDSLPLTLDELRHKNIIRG
jgi:flavin reductase (DIM6/NTAB) family NADH-FMN oxidoreductase RutF